MAPTRASDIATFRPANRCGSAQKILMRVSTFQREPRRVRARSMVSGGTERKPSVVSITTTNTAIRNAITIFGSAPVPNQMTQSGASATFGTLLSATNSGNSSRSSAFHFGDHDREQDPEDGSRGEACERDAAEGDRLLRETA